MTFISRRVMFRANEAAVAAGNIVHYSQGKHYKGVSGDFAPVRPKRAPVNQIIAIENMYTGAILPPNVKKSPHGEKKYFLA